MLGIIFAIVAGVLMSVQGVFNTRVTDTTGIWVTNSFVHITGFVVCLIAWYFTGRNSFSNLFNVENKFYLLGGVMGAAIIFTVVMGISALGPAYAIMLILIAQLAVAYSIELFGLFGTEQVEFEMKKLIGVGIMIIGIIIFKWK